METIVVNQLDTGQDDIRCPVFEQSAVVPYRTRGGLREVLLVTNNSGKRWVFPKGLVEPGLSPRDSALAEAYEEAGIRGHVSGETIGSYRYEKWGGVCVVEVFIMRVTETLDDWPESRRSRRWVSLDEARQVADERFPRDLLQRIAERLLE